MRLFEAFYLASGVVFMALGVVLILGRRHHLPALALAFYVLSLGSMYSIRALWGVSGIAGTTQSLIGFVAAAALATFAVSFPKRLEGRGWADAAIALAYGLVFILLLAWLSLRSDTTAPAFREMLGVSGSGLVLMMVSFHKIAVVSVAAWVLLPLRARRLGADEANTMRTLAHLAVAYLLVSPGGPFPGIVAAARGHVPVIHGVVVIGSAIAVLLLWLLSTLGAHHRAARNVILVLVGLTLGLGALHHVVGDLVVPVGRLLSALVLTYSVMAGQIEGLDVKVRWGISRSTIAAVFITVFFIASEGAQIFFGSENPWVGLAAAGALVFAIAPLQRGAERLAEKAVPLATPAPPPGFLEDSYRDAVRLALLDGALTREEELRLHEIAERLGVSGRRAHAILLEVETEARSGTP